MSQRHGMIDKEFDNVTLEFDSVKPSGFSAATQLGHIQPELTALLVGMDRKLDFLMNRVTESGRTNHLKLASPVRPSGDSLPPQDLSKHGILKQSSEWEDDEESSGKTVISRKDRRVPTHTSSKSKPSSDLEASDGDDKIPKRRKDKRVPTFDAKALNPVREICCKQFASEDRSNSGKTIFDEIIDDFESNRRRASFSHKAFSREIIKIVESDKRLTEVTAGRNTCLNGTWLFLTDPESSWAAGVYKEMMNPMIIGSALLSLAQGIDPILINDATFVVDMAFDMMFLTDILLQFICSPDRLVFMANAINIIDFVSSCTPLLLRCYTGFKVPDGDSGAELYTKTMLLCVLPVGRLLKLVRRFEKFHLVFRAFADSFEALPALLYTLSIMALSFTALIYLVEDREIIGSLPEALWFVIVTMMTVGYGDITPQSPMGYVIVSILIICSVLYMSIPIGIVGNAFNRVWRDRKKLLIIKRTRDRLTQWGIKPRDLFVLFGLFDKDGQGELTFKEFSKMMTLINVGLSDQRVEELFSAFDTTGTETVDSREFIRGIFPNSYYSLYGEVVNGEGRDSVKQSFNGATASSFQSELP